MPLTSKNVCAYLVYRERIPASRKDHEGKIMKSRIVVAAAAPLILGLLAACGGGGGVSASSAADAHGPISIWYSNNTQEVAWGEQMVASWNKLHPSEKVTGQQIPAAASSEEVIGAAITAGSEPCLIYNTAPAAVPTFEQQGGLVSLSSFPGGAGYIEAAQWKLTDPRVAKAYRELGDFYSAQSRYPEAEKIYQKRLELEEDALGRANPQLIRAVQDLDRK